MANKRKVEGEEIRLISEVPHMEFVRIVVMKTGRVLPRVYVLDGYSPSLRKYVVHAFDDINKELYLDKTREVQVGFTF